MKITKKLLSLVAAGVMFTSGSPAILANSCAVAENGDGLHFEADEIVYYFQDGDTLIKICNKFYGSSDLWKALAVYNGITNTRNIQNGTPIFIPKRRSDLLQYAALNGYGQYSSPDETPEKTQENIAHYENGDKVYYFQDGDTLRRIAKKFYGDAELWKIIANYNNITETRNIQNGTPIYLPPELDDRYMATPAPKPSKYDEYYYENGERVYTFKAGDTLWGLALRIYGNSDMWKALAAYNGITNARNVQNGQKIYLPYDLDNDLEYVEVPVKSKRKQEQEKYLESKRVHVFKDGDTLWNLATKYYGNGKYWKNIAAYNGIDNPKKVANGTFIYLPSKEIIITYKYEEPVQEVVEEVEERVHYFKDGDTLWNLATKYYGSGKYWKNIAAYNGIDNPKKVANGTAIYLPEKDVIVEYEYEPEEVVEEVVETFETYNDEDDLIYTVVKGDTLAKISKKFYGTTKYASLLGEYNCLEDKNLIRPGQELFVPGLDNLLEMIKESGALNTNKVLRLG